MKGNRGITLLELLVAMVLFSLLSVAVLMSLGTGISSLDRLRAHVAESRREVGAERTLELLLAGMMRVDASYVQPGAATPQTVSFFQGDPQTMRFVTVHSLEQGSRGVPRLVELTVIPGEGGKGVRLVMNERPYPGPYAAGMLIMGGFPGPAGGPLVLQFAPVTTGTGTFILADQLESCNFFYQQRQRLQVAWNAKWPLTTLPRAIRIDMKPRPSVTANIRVQPNEF